MKNKIEKKKSQTATHNRSSQPYKIHFSISRCSRADLQEQGGDDNRCLTGGVGARALRGGSRPQRGRLRLGVQQQRRELRGRPSEVRWQQRHPQRARLHAHVGARLRRPDLLGSQPHWQTGRALRLPDHTRGEAQPAEQLHGQKRSQPDG